MTVTRRQAEATDASLVHRPSEQLETSEPSEKPLAWAMIVLQMAQDKRHDLAAGTLRFWREKLKHYPESTVCKALMSGRWQLFPSVDDVISEVERIQKEPNNFVPCGKCINGWITVEQECSLYKGGKSYAAKRCQCWYEWAGR